MVHRSDDRAVSLQVNNRVQELRQQKGWSQADLAAFLKVSRQTVNALERGRYDPSLRLAFRIARIFALSIEEIFQPENE
nr:helix-turn-helix transcriptional regulator [Paracoccus sp. PAR01]